MLSKDILEKSKKSKTLSDILKILKQDNPNISNTILAGRLISIINGCKEPRVKLEALRVGLLKRKC